MKGTTLGWSPTSEVLADRSIEPAELVAPDLTTPEVRRAARKAGIDLDRFIARSERAAR